jgi:release factor glutamine methyltransferase
MKKISELDDSYWTYENADFETAYAGFLEEHKKVGIYEVAGLKFFCPSGVYHPHEFSTTRFALRGLYKERNKFGNKLLELGAGSGAIGICLASTGMEVTLLDVDPVAVECSKNNAAVNNIQVNVLQSDLFSAVQGQKYDVIFFNIPLLDKSIEDPLEIISCDEGGQLLARFLSEAPNHLLPNGQVYVSVGNISNKEALLRAIADYDEHIIFAEFYGGTGGWRWLISLTPRHSGTALIS